MHPDFDLAVLETPFSLCELPYVAAQKTIKKNKQVVGLGYSPNDSEFAAINFRIVSIESYEIEEREWNSGTEEMFVFKFDSSERGNSGGPIFGDDATILGVISQSIVDETTDNAYIVRATSIRPLVDMTSIETDWIVKFSNSSNFFNPTN